MPCEEEREYLIANVLVVEMSAGLGIRIREHPGQEVGRPAIPRRPSTLLDHAVDESKHFVLVLREAVRPVDLVDVDNSGSKARLEHFAERGREALTNGSVPVRPML